MVKIAYLIGNGFDIHLGLPSKYSQFYQWLHEVFKNHINDSKYKTLMNRKNDLVQELIMAFELKTNGEKNNFNSTDLWSDFEEELKNRIHQLSENEDANFKVGQLVKNLQDINALMTFYLKDKLKTIEKVNEFSANTVENSLSKPINQLESEQLNLLKSLIRNEIESHNYKANNHLINFIDFNYTPLLEQYLAGSSSIVINEISDIFSSSYKNMKLSDKIEYPNGNFNDTPELGIGTKDDLPDNLHLTKIQTNYLVKEAFARRRMDGRVTRIKKIIEEADIIIFYGLSLGQSDDLYISTVVSSLMSNPNKFVIIIMFNPYFEPSNITMDIMQHEEDIKHRLIDSYYHMNNTNSETIDKETNEMLEHLDSRIIVLFDNGRKPDDDSTKMLYFPYKQNVEKTAQQKMTINIG
ncbi:AbiH family protein [Leuconostoc suionicum]|uniref:AbiH family protein n=1 Tax=Leuconostoc suionicum TaxID=1511761 RepID=UPI0024ACD6F7|nr:AbiH family protein [Leuconostoc suionicum]MDI6498924.1 AbiH family protein [Leuconostoc suionicum]MDI6500822.1 AbiH family protein [Leuconostoc suionicum]